MTAPVPTIRMPVADKSTQNIAHANIPAARLARLTGRAILHLGACNAGATRQAPWMLLEQLSEAAGFFGRTLWGFLESTATALVAGFLAAGRAGGESGSGTGDFEGCGGGAGAAGQASRQRLEADAGGALHCPGSHAGACARLVLVAAVEALQLGPEPPSECTLRLRAGYVGGGVV